jgi:hypothetical protein
VRDRRHRGALICRVEPGTDAASENGRWLSTSPCRPASCPFICPLTAG